jgi:hypothetical protein
MSEENVELVRSLLPPSGTDLVPLVREDALVAAYVEAAAPFTDPEFECSSDWDGVSPRTTYRGADGLRRLFLDWLTPWASYRSEVEDYVDLGDRVLVLVRDYGRREDSDFEVEVIGASIWTIREQKVTRADLYVHRRDALEALGLPD